MKDPVKVIGYMRVSTDEQGDSRAGLEAQEFAIRAECERRGWTLEQLRYDVGSGGTMKKRDELGATLRDLANGYANTLIVAKLDRLSRSVIDFASIMETANKQGWSVNVLDLGVDTTTPNGELVANIIISIAQWERRIIGQRTKDGLAAVMRRGVHVGRKPNVHRATMDLIGGWRASGMSWQRIADTLTAQGVKTSQGGKWHGTTVRKLAAKAEAASD